MPVLRVRVNGKELDLTKPNELSEIEHDVPTRICIDYSRKTKPYVRSPVTTGRPKIYTKEQVEKYIKTNKKAVDEMIQRMMDSTGKEDFA